MPLCIALPNALLLCVSLILWFTLTELDCRVAGKDHPKALISLHLNPIHHSRSPPELADETDSQRPIAGLSRAQVTDSSWQK